MARFYGEVGYAENVEDPPESGIRVDHMTEATYQGDVIRASRRQERGDKVNEDISADVSISIVANEYAIANFFNIKYVRWMGVLWVVTSVEPRAPRLILNLGSVYNGPTPTAPDPVEGDPGV